MQVWDAEQGRLVRKTKCEKVPLNEKGKPVKRLAEALLADLLKSVHDGSFHEIRETSFVDKWLKEDALGGVKRSTYQAYKSHIRVHLKPAFGPLSLRALRDG